MSRNVSLNGFVEYKKGIEFLSAFMKANEKQLRPLRGRLPKGTIRRLAVFIWGFGFLNVLTLSGATAPPYQWVRAAGGSGPDKAFAATVDSDGNAYVTGYYQGRATFGGISLGTTGSVNFNIFVSKIDQSGNFQWVKTSTGQTGDGFCVGRSVAVDEFGNVYITGTLRGTATFGTISLTSVSEMDSFLLKLSTNGSPVWASRLGGNQLSLESVPSGIAVASDGSLYITGGFHGTASFGSTNLTSAGDRDIFLAKYSTNGGVVWVRKEGSDRDDTGFSVALDPMGDVLLAGKYTGALFVGGFLLMPGHPQNGSGRYFPTPFVAKYDSNGNMRWIKQTSTGYETAYAGGFGSGTFGVSGDHLGNAYICGSLLTAVYDPDRSFTEYSDPRLLISKYGPSGTLLWSKRIGSNGSLTNLSMGYSANAIAIDEAGDCYTTGYFSGTVPFEGTNLVSRGHHDIFVAKYNANGGFLWLKQAGGPSQDSAAAAAVTSAGELLLAGSFLNSATFDGANLNGSSNEVFIARLPASGVAPSIMAQPQSQTAIAGTNVTLTVAAVGTPPLTYQWRVNGSNIANPNAPALTISNAQPPNAGGYSVVITNAFGVVTSAVATLTVNFSLAVVINGNGTVARNPNLSSYPPGTTVILTASAAFGHGFIGWSGDANGTNNPAVLTMTTNKTVVARFASTVLIISIDGQGHVARMPDRPFYPVGEQVTLTATPARWHSFQGWGDGPTANSRLVTIGASNIYRAIFSPTTALETITVNGAVRTAPVGMPVIIVNGKFFADPTNSPFLELGQAGVEISSSFPNSSIFYTLDGSQPSFNSTFYGGTFVVRRSAVLRAIAYDANFIRSWEADPLQINVEPLYTVYAYVYDGGAVSLTPSKAFYRSNDFVTITATPLTGWQFLQWLGDLTGTNSSATVQVSRNLCVQAVFGTTLSTATAGSGAIALDSSPPFYPYGTVVRVTAVPAAGNYFGAWGNAASGTNNPLSFTVTEPQQTISAVFGELPAGQSTLTLLINGRGRVTANPRANRYATSQFVTLTAIADAHQHFVGWTGDATGSQTNLTLRMDQSKTITANFTARPRLSLGPCPGGFREGQFQFALTGDFGVRYQIETSASPAHNWSPLLTVTNTFGTTQVPDPTPRTDRRFYRATILP
jgi:uncharacterized repeat protein (TIGR02543 family)